MKPKLLYINLLIHLVTGVYLNIKPIRISLASIKVGAQYHTSPFAWYPLAIFIVALVIDLILIKRHAKTTTNPTWPKALSLLIWPYLVYYLLGAYFTLNTFTMLNNPSFVSQ